MDDKAANRAHSLIKGNTLVNINSGHDSHIEKPKDFIKILLDFRRNIE
jgi:pimeloyl-ACP methyl ester carboxylesterase